MYIVHVYVYRPSNCCFPFYCKCLAIFVSPALCCQLSCFHETVLWTNKNDDDGGGCGGRAGFTLSRALFGKNVGRQTLFFLEKTGDLFSHNRPAVSCRFSWKKLATFLLVITVAFIRFTRSLGCRPLFPAYNPFMGPLFVRLLFGRTCWTCLNPPLGGAGDDDDDVGDSG